MIENFEEKYTLDKKAIAKGGEGEIRLATEKKSKERYAVKLIKVPKKDDKERYTKEFKILSENLPKECHPNIACYYGWFLYKQNYVGILMEYIPGHNLAEVIKCLYETGYRFSEQIILKFMKAMLSALSYLTSHGIVHRDIKPLNIMFTEDKLKLIDFGTACHMGKIKDILQAFQTGKSFPKYLCNVSVDIKSKEKYFFSNPLTPYVFTPEYMPPEDAYIASLNIVKVQELLDPVEKERREKEIKFIHDEADIIWDASSYFLADIWAMGIVFYILKNVKGIVPNFEDDVSLLHYILNKNYDDDLPSREKSDKIIKEMLTYDFEQRPLAHQLLEEFFS